MAKRVTRISNLLPTTRLPITQCQKRLDARVIDTPTPNAISMVDTLGKSKGAKNNCGIIRAIVIRNKIMIGMLQESTDINIATNKLGSAIIDTFSAECFVIVLTSHVQPLCHLPVGAKSKKPTPACARVATG